MPPILGKVPVIAAALAAGVEPNHEAKQVVGENLSLYEMHGTLIRECFVQGIVSVKTRGGIWPKWQEFFLSLHGGVVVCRQTEMTEEDALQPYNMLRVDTVDLKSERYVSCHGGGHGNENLECYHTEPAEVCLP